MTLLDTLERQEIPHIRKNNHIMVKRNEDSHKNINVKRVQVSIQPRLVSVSRQMHLTVCDKYNKNQ